MPKTEFYAKPASIVVGAVDPGIDHFANSLTAGVLLKMVAAASA
jgi:hypothetical protein